MNELVPVLTPEASARDLAERCRYYLSKCRAANTVRAYRSDWQDFENWCQLHRCESLPATPESIAAYITRLADQGSKASTIQRRLTAISQAHELGLFE